MLCMGKILTPLAIIDNQSSIVTCVLNMGFCKKIMHRFGKFSIHL